jgi:hypothetical protein
MQTLNGYLKIALKIGTVLYQKCGNITPEHYVVAKQWKSPIEGSKQACKER